MNWWQNPSMKKSASDLFLLFPRALHYFISHATRWVTVCDSKEGKHRHTKNREIYNTKQTKWLSIVVPVHRHCQFVQLTKKVGWIARFVLLLPNSSPCLEVMHGRNLTLSKRADSVSFLSTCRLCNCSSDLASLEHTIFFSFQVFSWKKKNPNEIQFNFDKRLMTYNIYPAPPLGQDMTQGQFLSGV